MACKTEIEALLEERSKTHGPYSVFADFVQTLKDLCDAYAPYKGVLSNQQQEALDMILHKIGRIVTGNPNVKDHWDDIAGYATLGSKSITNDGIRTTPTQGQAQAAQTESYSPGLGTAPVPSEDYSSCS